MGDNVGATARVMLQRYWTRGGGILSIVRSTILVPPCAGVESFARGLSNQTWTFFQSGEETSMQEIVRSRFSVR